MQRVLISGALAYDRIMDYPGKFREHLLPDKLHSISVSFPVNPPTEQFGGPAGNIAYTLSLLKEESEIVSSAGSDFSRYDKHLREQGIDTETIQVFRDVPTASAYIITDEDDNQIAAFSSAAADRAYTQGIEPTHYTVAIASPGCAEDMLAVPKLCRERSLPFFFDPGQRIPALSKAQLIEGFDGAEVLFANDYEIKLIEEKTGLGEKELLEKVGALVITLGVEGSRVVTRESETNIASAFVEHPVDPTGAGDAYRAGFIKGRLAALPLDQCAKLGSVAAAYAVEKYGTQNHTFSLGEFRDRYTGAYGEDCPI